MAMLRWAAAAAGRRGASSGAAATHGVRSQSYYYYWHSQRSTQGQVDPLFEKFQETRMNMAKGNMLIDCLDGLMADRKKTLNVTRNSVDLWTALGFSFLAVLIGSNAGNQKARSERSLNGQNGAESPGKQHEEVGCA